MSNAPEDILAMSDEDWAKLDPTTFEAPVEEPEVETPEAAAPEVPAEADEPETPEVPAEADEPEAADEPTGEEGAAAGEEAEGEEEEAEGTEPEVPATPAAKDEPEVPAKTEPEVAQVNYEEEYKKLFAPFKANGKEIQIQSADDAIALMQMGANYNKKMAALKPNLKLMKLLENNGLLSEEKLSFLIDLDKKDPGAIGKLVKDSGIDPLDMEVGKSEYKPNTYSVDERELEFDAVVEQIQDTPTYSKTVNVISTKWDGPSKQVVAQNPQLLGVINTHVANGMYDLISNEVERERMFGRLRGMSDIEAYRAVGDAMDARGAFAHLAKPAAPATPPATPVHVPPAPKPVDTAARDKKISAAAPRAAAPAKSEPDVNPLALSDDEFAKLGNPRLM